MPEKPQGDKLPSQYIDIERGFVQLPIDTKLQHSLLAVRCWAGCRRWICTTASWHG